MTFHQWRHLQDGAQLWASKGQGKTIRSHHALPQVHLYGVNGIGKTSVLEGIWTMTQVVLGREPVPYTDQETTLQGYFEVDGHKLFMGIGFIDGKIRYQELWVWGPQVKGARGQTLYDLTEEGDFWHKDRPASLSVSDQTPLAAQMVEGPQLSGPFGVAQRLLRLMVPRICFPRVAEEAFWVAAQSPSFRNFFREFTYHMSQAMRLEPSDRGFQLYHDRFENKAEVQWDRLSKGIRRMCCLSAALYPLGQPGTMVLVDDLDQNLDFETQRWIAQNTPRESQLILAASTPCMVPCVDLHQINGLDKGWDGQAEIISASEYMGLSNKRRQETLLALLQGRLWGHRGSLSYSDTPPWWRIQEDSPGENN